MTKTASEIQVGDVVIEEGHELVVTFVEPTRKKIVIDFAFNNGASAGYQVVKPNKIFELA